MSETKQSLFRDALGKPSTMRWGTLLPTYFCVLIWGIVSLMNGTLVAFPPMLGTILLGLWTAKVVQKKLENGNGK